VTPERVELAVLAGSLTLKALHLPFLSPGKIVRVCIRGSALECEYLNRKLSFHDPITLDDGSSLEVLTQP